MAPERIPQDVPVLFVLNEITKKILFFLITFSTLNKQTSGKVESLEKKYLNVVR